MIVMIVVTIIAFVTGAIIVITVIGVLVVISY